MDSFSFSCARAPTINTTNTYIARAMAHFKINTQVLKLTTIRIRRIVSCPVAPRTAIGTVFLAVSVAWNQPTGQLAAGDVASVWTLWDQSPHLARQFLGSFESHKHVPVPEHPQINTTNMQYIYTPDICQVYCYNKNWRYPLRAFSKHNWVGTEVGKLLPLRTQIRLSYNIDNTAAEEKQRWIVTMTS